MTILKKKLTQKIGFPRQQFSGQAEYVIPFRKSYTPEEVVKKVHEKEEIEIIDSNLEKTKLGINTSLGSIILLILIGLAVTKRKKK